MGEGEEDPTGKPSRKAKKQAKKEKAEAEISGEKRPRPRDVFLKEAMQATKLAKVGPAGGALDNSDIGTEKAIGKKTRKKLQVMATKQAKKEQSKSIELAKEHARAAAALTSKAKVVPGRMKVLARDLVAKMTVRTPQIEQRMLAKVAERISAKPEAEIELFDVFFELHATAADKATKQLALLSAVAVFRDLVPGYRIREDRAKETSGGLSKTTLVLEKYEMTILQTYRRLFPLLEAALKQDPMAFAPALCALVKAASDFNYQQRLIQVAVRHANSPFEVVRRTVGEGLQDMIANDFRLEASKQLVLAIGGVAQACASSRGSTKGLHPELLHILLRLPVGRAEEAELHGDPSRGADDADLQRGLQEGSIHHGVDKLRKGEAELLYEVFCVYLRILRQRGVHSRELIAAALGGLAKWGQQVNLELLLEILKELKLTVQEAIHAMDELVALQGLYCALVLLSGPAKALITDATWIPDALTGALRIALPSLYSTHSEGSTGWPPHGTYLLDHQNLVVVKKELTWALEESSTPVLIMRTLEAAMRCSHGFGGASDGSLAALLEQLGLLAAGADSHVSIAILKDVAAMLKKHRKLHTLLDVEGGLFGLGGITDRALSIAWPLHVLSASLSPWPRKVGQNLASIVTSRRALVSDIFPARDSKDWLQCEFPMHLAGLLEAPRPGLLPQAQAGKGSDAESEDNDENAAEEEEEADAPKGKGKGKGKGKKGAAGGNNNAPASGAISRKKRRRTTFWTEAQLRKAVRSEY